MIIDRDPADWLGNTQISNFFFLENFYKNITKWYPQEKDACTHAVAK